MGSVTEEAFQRPPDAAPQALVRLLQDFTLEANRYVDTAGARKDMHRTDLNALAVIMRHTAKGLVVTPGVLRKELHLSSPAQHHNVVPHHILWKFAHVLELQRNGLPYAHYQMSLIEPHIIIAGQHDIVPNCRKIRRNSALCNGHRGMSQHF